MRRVVETGRCPHCSESVLQKSEEGTRLRLKGVMVSNIDGLHAKCYWCGGDVTVRPPFLAPCVRERLLLAETSENAGT